MQLAYSYELLPQLGRPQGEGVGNFSGFFPKASSEAERYWSRPGIRPTPLMTSSRFVKIHHRAETRQPSSRSGDLARFTATVTATTTGFLRTEDQCAQQSQKHRHGQADAACFSRPEHQQTALGGSRHYSTVLDLTPVWLLIVFSWISCHAQYWICSARCRAVVLGLGKNTKQWGLVAPDSPAPQHFTH